MIVGGKKTKIICRLLDRHFKDAEKTDRWLQLENLLLGGMRPVDMIKKGQSDRLISFIKNQIEENKLHFFGYRGSKSLMP